MPYNDPDPTDPSVLVGVVLPGDADSMREMAYVFAEEFARMGYTTKEILTIFKNPFYAGAHAAYRALSEESIQGIVDECVDAWCGIKFSILDFGREPSAELGRTPQSNDFGFSIEEGGDESKIGNLKSEMVERRGGNG